MELEAKTLKCAECKGDFLFSVGEQQFFAQRNLVNTPKRCPNCRIALRYERTGRDTSVLSDVSCADCGRNTRVPFKPRGHRPIYCNDCLAAHRPVCLPAKQDQELQLTGLA